MKRLMEEYDNYALSISVTTRDPRPGEEDGVSYFFRTEEEFDRMVEEDAFLEYARYVKHSYGTPKAYVEEQLDAGKDVLLEIEIQGALQVKEKRPDTLLVFITPPTAEELERRLRGRRNGNRRSHQRQNGACKRGSTGHGPVRLCPDQRRPRNLT
mgnify:CR=1 FL=1